MNRFTILLPAACLILLASCNFFGWTASVEDSGEYDLVMSEAESRLISGDFPAAIRFYTLALDLRPNDGPALSGRIQSRLLETTGGRSVYSAFPELFRITTSTNVLLGDRTPTDLGRLLTAMRALAADAATLDALVSSEVIEQVRGLGFAADTGFGLALVSILVAYDANTNGLPGEPGDGCQVLADFTIRVVTPSAGVDAALEQSRQTGSLARNYLQRMAGYAPLALAAGTPLSNLSFGLGRMAK